MSSNYISLSHLISYFQILGTDLTIWGTGAPLRQFIYSRDLAKLTVSIQHTTPHHTLYVTHLTSHCITVVCITTFKAPKRLTLYNLFSRYAYFQVLRKYIFALLIFVCLCIFAVLDMDDERVPQPRAHYSLGGRGRRGLHR
jgi:hypothetical protein